MKQLMFDKVPLPFLETFLGLTAYHHSSYYFEIIFTLQKFNTLCYTRFAQYICIHAFKNFLLLQQSNW